MGVESTVISFAGDKPLILRPGGITREMLEEVLGAVDVHPSALKAVDMRAAVPSPGMKHRHYAPKAAVTVVQGSNLVKALCDAYDACQMAGGRPYLLVDQAVANDCGSRRMRVYGSGSADLASHLFHSLRRLDEAGATHVYCQGVQPEGMGLAVMNRLLRAANFDVIQAEKEETLK